jgi:hypothetical protein
MGQGRDGYLYANCLLKARKTGNYKKVNRFRDIAGMVKLSYHQLVPLAK